MHLLANWISIAVIVVLLTTTAKGQDPLSILEPRGNFSVTNVGNPTSFAVRSLNATLTTVAYVGIFNAPNTGIRVSVFSIQRNRFGITTSTVATRDYTDELNVGNVTSGITFMNNDRDIAMAYKNGDKMCFQPIVLSPPPGLPPPPDGIVPTTIFDQGVTFRHISTVNYPERRPEIFSIVYAKINGPDTCLYHQAARFNGTLGTPQLMFCPITGAEQDPMAEAWFNEQDPNKGSFFVISKTFDGSVTAFKIWFCGGVGSGSPLNCSPVFGSLNNVDNAVEISTSRSAGSGLVFFAWQSSGLISISAIKYSGTEVIAISTFGETFDANGSIFNLVESLVPSAVALVLCDNTAVGKKDFLYNGTVNLIGSSNHPVVLDQSNANSADPLAVESIDNAVFAIFSPKTVSEALLFYYSVPQCGNTLVSKVFEECETQEPYCLGTCQCQFGLLGDTCRSSVATPNDVSTPTAPPSPIGNTPMDVPSNPNTPGNNNVGLSAEELTRIVVPSVVIPVALGAALAVLLVLLKRRKKKSRKSDTDNDKIQLQPANYQSMPTVLPMLTNDSKSSQASGDHVAIPEGLAPLNAMSPDERMKIPYSELKVIKEIGAGAYGKVFLGEWQMTRVALKVSGMTSAEEFMREAALLINLRPHPNVVQILGVSNDGMNVVMIMEYCDGGSLDHLVFDKELPLDTKIHYLSGIAKGIYHLHKNKIIHRDLAARNILLSRGEPKISDFGMSRKVQEATAHSQTKSTVGPLRWMAPESLKEARYSTKSDAWSFGILCWEIMAGKEPHLDTDPLSVGIEIRDKGLTPTIPDNWSPEIVQIMKDCWQMDADKRPEFAEICRRIGNIEL